MIEFDLIMLGLAFSLVLLAIGVLITLVVMALVVGVYDSITGKNLWMELVNKLENYSAKKKRKENLKMKYGFDDSYDKYIA